MKIEPRENGPLVVKDVPRLTSKDGALEIKPVVALCRCGASGNKPFCDGSHNKVGFSSARDEKPGLDKLFHYKGKDITVHYNPLLCSHAAECGTRLKAVFNPDVKPWVQPDNGSVEAIKEVMAACPSGALSFSEGDEAVRDLKGESSGITIEEHGPYHVTGLDLAERHQNQGSTAGKYVLCRCGMSKNKPYCDGTHRDEGWRED